MKKLGKDWLTEGLIDFEYKKYLLLSYFQGVKSEFKAEKLYPVFTDLLFHFNNLNRLKENKALIYENFPKELSRADFDKLEVIYKEMVNDDKIMAELEEIMSFAIPQFKDHISEGKDMYDRAEEGMQITPVGIAPIYKYAGYLFIYVHNQKETSVYEYEISLFQSAEETYRGVYTNLLEKVEKSIYNTFEALKLQLIKRNKQLPNPATFLVDSNRVYPEKETLLPIAKRMLVKYVTSAAA